jgi:hypothetical protein
MARGLPEDVVLSRPGPEDLHVPHPTPGAE